LGILFILLVVIPSILFVGLLGLLIFIFINPSKNEPGKKKVDISYYLGKVNYKIVFFFISLFILVYCMEVNGTIHLLEVFITFVAPSNLFLVCIFILVLTSLLSGLLDNVPVTVIFIPIIQALISTGFAPTPILVAFILGINLGGNIFPQGSAADMMTLELSEKYCADDLNYRVLLKVGGLFAILHILLGVGYLAIMVFVFF
jgi:Na+/H+ antiporter NhaD/arsenite permease-like protein